MMERLFHLAENKTTVRREMLCGLTTFLTMVYILFANSDILADTGMPWRGVFMATALTAAICTITIAVYANLPFAMAPGMGMNTMFAYTICATMGYHWKEALAISFLAGIIHVMIMSTSMRKLFVNAFPEYLRVASSVGLGIFIAYMGIKSSGFLIFNIVGQSAGIAMNEANTFFTDLPTRITTISGGDFVPGLIKYAGPTQFVAFVGLSTMIILSVLEKKSGERYGALPLGILIATFVGIPLNVTRINGIPFADTPIWEGFDQIFCSFFGNPGLLSIFQDPTTAVRTLIMICILNLTGILDSVGTMIGIGQIHNAKIFDSSDIKKFNQESASSRLDKALIANSAGNEAAALFGSSASTIYLESVTGIVAGGRTGLTGFVTGMLFLMCLPLAGFFHMIPSEAVAPALILAGVSMLTRMKYINWHDFEESFPSFMTMIFIPFSLSILDGISIGVIVHVAIQFTLGKRREVHPVLIFISIFYIFIKIGEHILFA